MSGHGYAPREIPSEQEKREYQKLLEKVDAGGKLTKSEEYALKRYELLYTDKRNK